MNQLDKFEADMAKVLQAHGLDTLCKLTPLELAQLISTFLGIVRKVRDSRSTAASPSA